MIKFNQNISITITLLEDMVVSFQEKLIIVDWSKTRHGPLGRYKMLEWWMGQIWSLASVIRAHYKCNEIDTIVIK